MGNHPQHTKTELQLFPKKCEVKLQEYSNHNAEKNENFFKNGQEPRSL